MPLPAYTTAESGPGQESNSVLSRCWLLAERGGANGITGLEARSHPAKPPVFVRWAEGLATRGVIIILWPKPILSNDISHVDHATRLSATLWPGNLPQLLRYAIKLLILHKSYPDRHFLALISPDAHCWLSVARGGARFGVVLCEAALGQLRIVQRQSGWLPVLPASRLSRYSKAQTRHRAFARLHPLTA